MLKKGRNKRIRRERERGREREGEGGRERERGREGRERGRGRGRGGRERERERIKQKGGKERGISIIQCSHLLPSAMVVFIIDGPTSESLTAATVTSTVTPSTKYVALVMLCSNIVSLSLTSTIALVTKGSSLLNITVLAETL